jgi:DNA phosphorothioation-dependent restriction protein DptG
MNGDFPDLSMAAKQRIIDDLILTCRAASWIYYNTHKQVLTDRQYDALEAQVKILCRLYRHNELWLTHVGAPMEESQDVMNKVRTMLQE